MQVVTRTDHADKLDLPKTARIQVPSRSPVSTFVYLFAATENFRLLLFLMGLAVLDTTPFNTGGGGAVGTNCAVADAKRQPPHTFLNFKNVTNTQWVKKFLVAHLCWMRFFVLWAGMVLPLGESIFFVVNLKKKIFLSFQPHKIPRSNTF